MSSPENISQQRPRLGEDIFAAKKIYEFFYGEQFDSNVNLWMKEARAFLPAMRVNSLQDGAKTISGIKPLIKK